MSLTIDSEAAETTRTGDAARWGVCFILVAVVHGLGAVVLSRHTAAPPPLPPDAPALLLDLAPAPAPAPSTNPDPPTAEPAMREAADPPPIDPPPIPDAAPPPPPLAEPPPPEAVAEPPPAEPPPPEPVVALPPAEPPPPVVSPELPPEPKPPPPPRPPPRPKPVVPRVQPRPAVAPRPPTPVPPVTRPAQAPVPPIARPAATVQAAPGAAAAASSWQGRLHAYLARYKRYPPEAQMRHEEGTVLLQFTMTRDGRVLSFGLARGSGHAALDREALELLRRAQPLPPLPPEVTQPTIAVTVPLPFHLR